MRLYPSKAKCCAAARTAESAVVSRRVRPHGRYPTVKRAKMILHQSGPLVDLEDGEFQVGERFWHWSDQDV